jgi:hypothetical protein
MACLQLTLPPRDPQLRLAQPRAGLLETGRGLLKLCFSTGELHRGDQVLKGASSEFKKIWAFTEGNLVLTHLLVHACLLLLLELRHAHLPYCQKLILIKLGPRQPALLLGLPALIEGLCELGLLY